MIPYALHHPQLISHAKLIKQGKFDNLLCMYIFSFFNVKNEFVFICSIYVYIVYVIAMIHDTLEKLRL